MMDREEYKKGGKAKKKDPRLARAGVAPNKVSCCCGKAG